MVNAEAPALQADGLSKVFQTGTQWHKQFVHALWQVSFRLPRGTVLAVVGESGSGKSTLIRVLAHLLSRTSGKLYLNGEEIPARLHSRQLFELRRRVQIIFQDPFGALNPHYPVDYLLRRPALNYGVATAATVSDLVHRTLEDVGLAPAQEFLRQYPHELSGGQRQRVVVARALITQPQIILADEPTSMLDVSIRMSVLNLLKQLQTEYRLSYLFITHDLASARYISDHLLVMYAGQGVEGGESAAVIAHPLHPYTQLLLSAVPKPGQPDPIGEIKTSTEPPDLSSAPRGCVFRQRCPLAMERCEREVPPARIMAGDHWVACHAV